MLKTKLFRLPVIIFLILLLNYSNCASAQQSGEVYIYSYESPSLELLLRYFNGKSEWNATFYSLNNSVNYERFLEIASTLVIFVPSLYKTQTDKEDECKVCGKTIDSWDEIVISYAPPPLIGFFHNGKLLAITVGIIDSRDIDQVLKVNAENDTILFTRNGTYVLESEAVSVRLEELFLEQKNSGMQTRERENVSNLIAPILLLALSDSINPCTFAVFTALLLIALYSFDKSKVAIIGLSFILAIFIGYYALGLGLLQILVDIPHFDKIIAIAGLFIGAFSITRGLKPKFKSPLPKSLQKFMNSRISKSYVSPSASFLLGFAATFTLLPCSSGPYIVGLGLLSTLNSVPAYILLALYNIIFVAPLIVILTAILISRHYSLPKAFRSKKLRVMELLSGILLVAICIYMLLSK